jgi:hypothetical protein
VSKKNAVLTSASSILITVVDPGKGYYLVPEGSKLKKSAEVSIMVEDNKNVRMWIPFNHKCSTETNIVNSNESDVLPFGYYRQPITKSM